MTERNWVMCRPSRKLSYDALWKAGIWYNHQPSKWMVCTIKHDHSPNYSWMKNHVVCEYHLPNKPSSLKLFHTWETIQFPTLYIHRWSSNWMISFISSSENGDQPQQWVTTIKVQWRELPPLCCVCCMFARVSLPTGEDEEYKKYRLDLMWHEKWSHENKHKTWCEVGKGESGMRKSVTSGIGFWLSWAQSLI